MNPYLNPRHFIKKVMNFDLLWFEVKMFELKVLFYMTKLSSTITTYFMYNLS